MLSAKCSKCGLTTHVNGATECLLCGEPLARNPQSKATDSRNEQHLARECSVCGMTTHIPAADRCLLCQSPFQEQNEKLSPDACNDTSSVPDAPAEMPHVGGLYLALIFSSFSMSAGLTLLFLIWFLVAESESPGLSFAVALIGTPIPLIFFALTKSTKLGITKDGKTACWTAFVIAVIGFQYIAIFFSDWMLIAAVWLIFFAPVIVSIHTSATTREHVRQRW